MTYLLPAGWASRQHGSPGALREGGWALPAAVPMQTGWDVTGCSPGMHNPLYTPGRVGNRGRPGPSVLAASAPTLRVGAQGWLRVRELCRQGTGRVQAGYGQGTGRVRAGGDGTWPWQSGADHGASPAPSPPMAPTPLIPASWLMAPGPR